MEDKDIAGFTVPALVLYALEKGLIDQDQFRTLLGELAAPGKVAADLKKPNADLLGFPEVPR